MRSWQQRIEKQLSAIQQTNKGHWGANTNTIDVYKEYEDNEKLPDTSMPG